MDDPTRQNICIVGNSTSIKERGLGSTINQFENVCRINDWVVKGHQKDVGSKITHWVTGAGKQIPRWSKRRKFDGKHVVILWPAPLFNHWKKFSKKKFHADGSMFQAVPIIKKMIMQRLGYRMSEYIVWNDNDSEDLYDTKEGVTFVPDYISQIIAEKSNVAYPTTGLATIAYFKFVLRYNVYTIGFDFFQEHKDHYWDKNGNKCKIEFHELEQELKTYNKWVEEGLINKL
jgi:hypothetical protein